MNHRDTDTIETFLRLATVLVRGEDEDEPQITEPARSDFVFSTELEGRDGDVIDQGSWRLDEWRANPVILDSHYGDVIGRGVSAEVVEVKRKGKLRKELRGTIEWDLETPRGAIVGGQHLRGFRKAVSVRWSPGKITPRNELPEDHLAFAKPRKVKSPWGDYEVVGRFMEQCTLLEVSSVGVPGDPRALQIREAAQPAAPIELVPPSPAPDAVREILIGLIREDPEVARALRAFALSEPAARPIDYAELLASRIVGR